MASSKFKILAFDPGLTTTGWSLLEGTTSSGDLVVLKIGEIHPGPTVDRAAYRDEVDKYDKRTITLSYLREQVRNLIDELKPNFICSEDIFINMRRPQAYGALCMFVCTVRMLCRDHVGKYLVTIPTKTCKKEVCGIANEGKNPVQQSLLNHKHVKFKDDFDRLHLSEHEADSIAVAVAFRNKFNDFITKELNVQ